MTLFKNEDLIITLFRTQSLNRSEEGSEIGIFECPSELRYFFSMKKKKKWSIEFSMITNWEESVFSISIFKNLDMIFFFLVHFLTSGISLEDQIRKEIRWKQIILNQVFTILSVYIWYHILLLWKRIMFETTIKKIITFLLKILLCIYQTIAWSLLLSALGQEFIFWLLALLNSEYSINNIQANSKLYI